ncbi:MAG: transglutaminase family protein [Chloroflexota bacterium]
MYYSIRHMTRFRYSAPISQSVMELRMEPRSERGQRCLSFQLALNPHTRVMSYRDYLGNVVHHFDIPGQHRQLVIVAESTVEMKPAPDLPESLPADAWDAIDHLARGEYDMLLPSKYTAPTPLLEAFAAEINAVRRDDPMTLLRELNTAIYRTFDYEPQSTEVDSPIDDALQARQGVCQDFAHIMLALLRHLGVPCRYVSGYLFHYQNKADRSAQDASHAWIEALLPDLGWVGFDPTNNLLCGERHIRVAIGRDYSDVPPTQGVFKGEAESELSVGVRVALADEPQAEITLQPVAQWISGGEGSPSLDEQQESQQQ